MNKDRIGNRYGNLMVLSIADAYNYKDPAGKSRKIKRYNVQCDCGNITLVFGNDLKTGKTRSCNQGECKLHYTDRSMPAFNMLYSSNYKTKAKQRGLEFTLSREQFKQLIDSECYYCGATPYLVAKIKTGNHISEYTYNGIDRIDNAKGYTIDNVVTACSLCNHAKHTMTHDDFIALAKRIADRH